MAYKISTIQAFKGLSQNLALTSGDPSFALDCINVIPSSSGLAKVRLPVPLTPASPRNGPDQFAMYEGHGSKQVIAFFGQTIFTFRLDDFMPFQQDTNPAYQSETPWSVVLANEFAYMQNGSSNPLKYDGTSFRFWGTQFGGQPFVDGPTTGPGITLTQGRKYRLSYQTDAGHVGTASIPSNTSGPATDEAISVQLPQPTFTDFQVNALRLYATLDGGEDYFFHSLIPVTPGATGIITILDTTPDDQLDQTERAPLINMIPPRAKYLVRWGARIFMFNLPDENDKWVAYTGYNRIFVGRPEETCPPGNRIKLETGADEITGGGVIDAGVIAFDKTNRMFMFRGQPEDVTVTAPVEFTLFLKELPWQFGCASHFTIQSTPVGLVWLSSQQVVYRFDGVNKPVPIDDGVEPLLQKINYSQIRNCRSAFWQYTDRDWYVLAVPIAPSTALNYLLIFDLKIGEDNRGCFPLSVGDFSSLGVIEMVNGKQKLIIGQNGQLKEIRAIDETVIGLSDPACGPASIVSGGDGTPVPVPIVFTPCPGFNSVMGMRLERSQLASTQFNIRMGFQITDDRLKDLVHGGFVTNPNAFDVRPSLETCTMLAYELVDGSYNPVAGKIEIWVEFPQADGMDVSTDTLFQLNIGNPSIVTDGSTIWPNYNSVVHVGTLGGSIVSIRDSAKQMPNTDWTNVGGVTLATGVIGNSASFPGTNAGLRYVGSGMGLPFSGVQDGTFAAWINTTATGAQRFIAGKVNFTVCDVGSTASFWELHINPAGRIVTDFRNTGWTQIQTVTGTTVVNDGIWHRIVITRVGPTVSIYVDGELDIASTATATVNITDDGGSYEIGTVGFGHCGLWWNGRIDEIVSINNFAWDGNRVAVDYANGLNAKNPSILYTIDPTTVGPPTPGFVPTLTAFWESGYFGNEDPGTMKFFRYGRVLVDQGDIRIKRRLIDDHVRNVQTMDFESIRAADGKISTNKKARRLSYEIRFAEEDICQNVLELVDYQIPVSQT